MKGKEIRVGEQPLRKSS